MTALLVLAGLVIGVSLTFFGAGGTALAFPLLLTLGFAPKSAIVLSLLVVTITAALAALSNLRTRNIDWRATGFFGTFAIVGGYAGGRAGVWVPSDVLVLMFGFLMLVALVVTWRTHGAAAVGVPGSVHPLIVGAQGVLVGVFTGLVGAGGGFLVVSSLTRLSGTAVLGTAFAVVTLKSGAALFGWLGHVTLELADAAPLALGAMLGGLGSVWATQHGGPRRLHLNFAALSVAVVLWLMALAGVRFMLIQQTIEQILHLGSE